VDNGYLQRQREIEIERERAREKEERGGQHQVVSV
jgi:hypothetical protein